MKQRESQGFAAGIIECGSGKEGAQRPSLPDNGTRADDLCDSKGSNASQSKSNKRKTCEESPRSVHKKSRPSEGGSEDAYSCPPSPKSIDEDLKLLSDQCSYDQALRFSDVGFTECNRLFSRTHVQVYIPDMPSDMLYNYKSMTTNMTTRY